MTSRLRKRYMDCSGLSIEEAEAFADGLIKQQRDILFLIGDLARYCEARWPDIHNQVWPEWVSPGTISRPAGVCKAYPTEADRQIDATYTQYKQVASKPDRLHLLQAMVDEGLTSDQSRKAQQEQRQRPTDRKRWLLAFDTNYYVHKRYPRAKSEAANEVALWIQRTAGRLKEKGLTDVVCCFDGPNNHRKKLTEGWEDGYKQSRKPKDAELVQQLQLVRELLEGHGFACISIDGMESDDVLASFASQFDGLTTIATVDKDLRQCLGPQCNILLGVEWDEDDSTGVAIPKYKWYTAKPTEKLVFLRLLRQHVPIASDEYLQEMADYLGIVVVGSVAQLRSIIKDEIEKQIAERPRNLLDDFGMLPEQWADYQTICGDTADDIKGVIGIGEKGATDLIKKFGTVEAAIESAKADDERIKDIVSEKKRIALIEFETKLKITRQLVTLRTNLPVDVATRIPGGE